MSLIPVSHLITTVDYRNKGMEGRPKHLDDEIDVKIFDKFYLYSFTLCCILSNRFSTYRGWEGGGLMSHNVACR